MNGKTQSALPESLQEVFARYRKRSRIALLLRGVAISVAAVLACWLVMIGLDRLCRFGLGFRFWAFSAWVCAAAFCCTRYVLLPAVRRITDRRVALYLGAAAPEMEDDLVSAVEMAREGDRDPVTRAFIRTGLRDIAARARQLEVRNAVPVRPVARAAGITLSIAAVMGALYVVYPEPVSNALMRVLRPFQEIAFFSYTRLELAVRPKGDVAARGSEAVISVALSGRPADAVSLDVRKGTGGATFSMKKDGSGYVYRTGPLYESVTYRARAGDGMTSWRNLKVLPPPWIESRVAEILAPPYAQRKPVRVVDWSGPLEIIAGGGMKLELTTKGAQEAVLKWNGSRVAMSCSGHDRFVTPDLIRVDKTCECTIDLRGEAGLTNSPPDLVRVVVKPDELPAVKITKPGYDAAVLPGEVLEVGVSATDDLGLKRLELTARVVRGKESTPWTVAGGTMGKGDTRSLDLNVTPDEQLLMMEPGDTLECRGDACDFAPPENSRHAFSETLSVRMIDELDHIALLLAKLEEIRADIAALAGEQEDESEVSSGLGASPDKEIASEDTGRKLESGERRQRDLIRRDQGLAAKVDALGGEMMRNSAISERTLANIERLGSGLQKVAGEPMARASSELRKSGASQEPAPRRQQLELARTDQHDAAEQLRDLTDLTEGIRAQALREGLGKRTLRLAEKQRRLKENTLEVAPHTAGKNLKELPQDLRDAVENLMGREGGIQNGVHDLSEAMSQASQALSFNDPKTAEEMERMLDELKNEVADRAQGAMDLLRNNTLFRSLPDQEDVASRLERMAGELGKGSGDPSTPEDIEKTLQEFIKRQQAIIGEIEARLASAATAKKPTETASTQRELRGEVRLRAAAIASLAAELKGFKSETADKLRDAAREMLKSAVELDRAADDPALPHAKKALAYLKESEEKLKQEQPQMQQASKQKANRQAALLLGKILGAQKRLNRETHYTEASRQTLEAAGRLKKLLQGLVGKQDGVRGDTGKLRSMAQGEAAQIIDLADKRMEKSSTALGAGATGKDTQTTQTEIVALLEKLLEGMGQGGGRGGGSGAGAGMAGSGGGYRGGGEGPATGNAGMLGSSEWRKVRSRFEGKLGAGWEETSPPEFRDLLNAYFDTLREE